MTQNPFGEGFDLGSMLEQAQQMQAQLVQAQADLAEQRVEGVAGGVTVVVSGTGELFETRVRPGAFDGNDEESLADLGDLVVAAYRDAKAAADKLGADTLGPITGGLGGGDMGEMFGGLSGGPGV